MWLIAQQLGGAADISELRLSSFAQLAVVGREGMSSGACAAAAKAHVEGEVESRRLAGFEGIDGSSRSSSALASAGVDGEGARGLGRLGLERATLDLLCCLSVAARISAKCFFFVGALI